MKLALVAFSQTWPSTSWRVGKRPALLKMLANTRPMTQATAVVTRKYATVFHVLLHFRRRLAPGFQPRGKIIQIAGTQHHRESVRNINAGKNIIQHINFS